MFAGMTKAAWRRGYINAMICMVGMVIVFTSLQAIVKTIFHQTTITSAIVAFLIIWIILFLICMYNWLYRILTSKKVLLDCGPAPTRILFIFNGIIFTIGGFTFGDSLSEHNSMLNLGCKIMGLSFMLYWISMAMGRLQIRENGIWCFWQLTKWSKIKSYRWVGEKNATLMIQTKNKFKFLGKGAIPVPITHKTDVDNFLKQYDVIEE